MFLKYPVALIMGLLLIIIGAISGSAESRFFALSDDARYIVQSLVMLTGFSLASISVSYVRR